MWKRRSRSQWLGMRYKTKMRAEGRRLVPVKSWIWLVLVWISSVQSFSSFWINGLREDSLACMSTSAKWYRIFKDPQLRKMQISFAMWHFSCTSIVLWLASRPPFNLFVAKRLPFLQMLPLCCFFAGFLILGNLSLAFNSVGFYQSVTSLDCVSSIPY